MGMELALCIEDESRSRRKATGRLASNSSVRQEIEFFALCPNNLVKGR